MNLKKLFPNASPSFLKLHGLDQPRNKPVYAIPKRPTPTHAPMSSLVAPRLPDPKPEPAPRKESLDSNQAQKAGQGRFEVSIERRGTKTLDADNLAGGAKYLCDALRYEGIINDDDPASLVLHVSQRKTRKEEIGTQITIIPIP